MPFQDLTNDPEWKFACYSVDYEKWLSELPENELTYKLVAGWEVIKETVQQIIQKKFQ